MGDSRGIVEFLLTQFSSVLRGYPSPEAGTHEVQATSKIPGENRLNKKSKCYDSFSTDDFPLDLVLDGVYGQRAERDALNSRWLSRPFQTDIAR